MSDVPDRLTSEDLDAAYAFGGVAHDTLVGLVRRAGGRGQGDEALDRAAPGSPVAAMLRYADGAHDSLEGLDRTVLLAAGAAALLDAADPHRAIPVLEGALSAADDDPAVGGAAARLLELAYLRAGRPGRAARLVDDRKPEGLAPAELRRVEWLRRAGDERAVQGYLALLMEGPDPYALACLEEIYEARSDAPALAALHAEAARRETDPAVRALHRYRLGEVLQAMGRADEAAEAFARAEDGGDLGALVRSRRLRLLREGSDAQAYARSLRDQADALGDTARARALLVMAGRVALEKGEVGAAVGWLQQARQRAGGAGRAAELLAEALLAVGDLAGIAALHEGPLAALLARTPYPGVVAAPCSLLAADAAGDRLGVSLSCRRWAESLPDGPMAAALLTAAACFAPSDAAARDHLARAAQSDPTFVPGRVAQVRTAQAAGRRREVLVAAKAAADIVDDRERARGLLIQAAEAADALGEDDQAAALRAEAGQEAPTRLPALPVAPDPEELVWAAGRLESERGDVEALLLLAEDADRRELRADAAELYERAWAAVGRDGEAAAVRALTALERLYEDLGRVDERLGVLTRLFEASEGDERRRWRRILADLRADHGELTAAAQVMNEALHDEPPSPGALRRLAELAGEAGRHDLQALALESLARNIGDSAERSRLYLTAALLYRDELGGGGVVLESAMLAFMCDNDHREAFELLEELYTADGRWREVLGIYDLALSRARRGGPYDAGDLLRSRGLVEARRLDRPQDAVQTLLCALQEAPRDERTASALEALVTVTGDLDSRVRMLELRAGALTAAERGPVLAMAAAVCAEAGEHARAVQLLLRARRLDRSDTRTGNALRRSLGALGDWAGLAELELELADRASSAAVAAARLADAAAALEKAGDTLRAVAALERASDATPADPGLLDELERLCDETHSWDRLLEVHERKLMLTDSPRERARIRFRIGSLHELALGDDDAAAASYRMALQEDPACVPALHGLREIHVRHRDWLGAVRALEAEVAAWQAPDVRAELWSRIAEIRLDGLDDEAGAAQAWRQALEQVDGHLPALRGLVPILIEEGRWESAARHAERWADREAATGDTEGRVLALTCRARTDLALGGVRRAAQTLIEALSADPTHEGAREALGELVERPAAGALPQSMLSELERVAREAGDDRDLASALLLKGRAAQAEGRRDDATALYREALTRSPASDGPRRALAEALAAGRRWGEVAEVLAGAAEAGAAGWIGFLIDAAYVRLDFMDDPKGATSLFDRAAHALGPTGDTGVTEVPVNRDTTERDRQVRRALFGHAQALRGGGDPVAGVRQMLRLIDLEETRPVGQEGPRSLARYRRYLGLLQFEAGDREAGLTELRAAVAEAPGDPECALTLARLLREGGAPEAEAVLAEAARQAEPEEALRLDRARARQMARTGRPDGALALLEQSVLVASDPTETLCTLAEIERSAFDDGGRRAEARYAGLLKTDLTERRAWRGLADLHDRARRIDRLYLTRSLWSLLSPLVDEEGLTVPAHESRARAERPGALDGAVLEGHVLHPLAEDPLWSLWPAAWEHLDRTYPEAPPPDDRARPVDLERRDDAVAAAVRSVCAMVRVPGDLEVWIEPAGDRVYAVPGAPARLFVGAAWAGVGAAWEGAEVDPAALRFHIGRALALLGGDRAHAAGDPALALPAAQLVAALFREVVGLPPDAGGAPPDLPRRLVKLARDRLAEQPRWSEATPDPAAFIEGVRRTTDRIGMLASGDPRAAVLALLAQEGRPPALALAPALAPAPAAFAASDRPPRGDWAAREDVADLVRWTLSEHAAAAREAMGLGLGGAPTDNGPSIERAG